MIKPQAIAILGPTGSGKTPIGSYLEEHPLGNTQCVHFDFGSELRKTAASRTDYGILSRDIERIQYLLANNLLLENDRFYLAEKIFNGFAKQHLNSSDDIILLNGLPRHLSQAKKMDCMAQIKGVIHLICPPTVVLERISSNVGGDRTERKDDSPEEIRRKLKIYDTYTRPLLEYYNEQSVPIMSYNVEKTTMSSDVCTSVYEKFSPLFS